MDRTLVFYWPRNREAAEALAASIPGAGVRSLKGWSGYVEEPADRVVVDDASPDVAAAYQKAGSVVRMLSGAEVEGDEAREPADDGGSALPDGYTVTKSGPWYKVLDANGEQVGNAKRSEPEAIAQVAEV